MSSPDPSAIPVRCACGKRYRVPAKLAGKEASCNACGARIKIPEAGAADPFSVDVFASSPFPTGPSTASVKSKSTTSVAKAGAKPSICGVCQTAVKEGETCVTCASCNLVYHEECWNDNYGCATYGCAEVNALKPGPDVSIPTHSLPQYVAPAPNPGALGHTKTESENPLEGLPVGYLLLGASVLAMLLSCVMCGVPSLIFLIGAIVHLAVRPGVDLGPTIGAAAVSGIGFLLGFLSSTFLFLAM